MEIVPWEFTRHHPNINNQLLAWRMSRMFSLILLLSGLALRDRFCATAVTLSLMWTGSLWILTEVSSMIDHFWCTIPKGDLAWKLIYLGGTTWQNKQRNTGGNSPREHGWVQFVGNMYISPGNHPHLYCRHWQLSKVPFCHKEAPQKTIQGRGNGWGKAGQDLS